ncbi:LOW QUALITY PROTEIN: semaphorin-6D-like [Lethenteron reissneri]|uniref:LOW QUALITY PROTEIN: semaphorin-6D-like n=1 Tax=Lethenteron reissneri TaxID=7753 RepID=UPI002AB5FA9B|nr:LOW QUALITY PROTEIN: semaphorin-6D-like [Lethenteron reissneri]
MAERQEVDRCLMNGKTEEECHNFMKVVAPRGDGLLFVCGTNAYSPTCRNYQLADLSFTGEQTSGLAKCPFDPRQGGAAAFAGPWASVSTRRHGRGPPGGGRGGLREPGARAPPRSLKLDSKWLKEPVFVRVLEHGQHVYFFFTEIAVELSSMGKVLFSRVARVCKSDAGGSQRVLDGHWSSFVKARLNCSVGGEAPGDAPFYFNELQGVSEVLHIGGRELVLGVFTTPLNSIHGSAVCAFDMEDVASTFQGRYREQRGPDGPCSPCRRPGACAGEGEAAAFPRSPLLPDEALSFAKTHTAGSPRRQRRLPQPWFVRSGTRYRLTHIAVGREGGAPRQTRRCGDAVPARVRALLVDAERHAVFLAFSSCVLRLPLSHCARHADCKKCGLAWRPGTLLRLVGGDLQPRHAIIPRQDSVVTSSGAIREPRVSTSPGRVPAGIVWLCLLGAFALGAALSCVATVCLFRRCRPRRPERPRKPPPAAPAPGAGPGPAGPYGRSRLLEELLLEGAARGKVDAVARSAALLVPLMAVGKVDVTALEWAGGLPPPFPRAGGRPLPELAALPTPESPRPRRAGRRGGGGATPGRGRRPSRPPRPPPPLSPFGPGRAPEPRRSSRRRPQAAGRRSPSGASHRRSPTPRAGLLLLRARSAAVRTLSAGSGRGERPPGPGTLRSRRRRPGGATSEHRRWSRPDGATQRHDQGLRETQQLQVEWSRFKRT